MITSAESASELLEAIRPHIIIPDHVAEADVLTAIRTHIAADRHQMAVKIANEATPLIHSEVE